MIVLITYTSPDKEKYTFRVEVRTYKEARAIARRAKLPGQRFRVRKELHT